MILPPLPYDVSDIVESWPAAAQQIFFDLRDLIYATAADDPAIGPLTETLKWGEPSFLTEVTRSGSTLRVAWKAKYPDEIGLFVICRTDMLADIRDLFPQDFRFEGTRAAFLPLETPINADAVAFLVRRALRYHLI